MRGVAVGILVSNSNVDEEAALLLFCIEPPAVNMICNFVETLGLITELFRVLCNVELFGLLLVNIGLLVVGVDDVILL